MALRRRGQLSQQRDGRTKPAWLVTGAGRSIGVNIAITALAAGHAVATGCNSDEVTAVSGDMEDLLAIKLDSTSPIDAAAALNAAAAMGM